MSATSIATPTDHRAEQTSAQVVRDYLDAFYGGDFETVRALLADDLAFRGPFVEVNDADAFLASAEPLRAIVRGHRLIKQWQDNDQVSTLYEMNLGTPSVTGSVLVSEWNAIRDGKVASASLVFDTDAFRKLLTQARNLS
jgi:ketosteroid isomerase-like protein